MTDLDELFGPENKFIVPVTIHLSTDDELRLRKFVNLHYLGDVDANELVDGQFQAKYPDKETQEYKDATWKISGGYAVNLAVEFDANGNPTFEVVKNG
ncbi:Hypothetical-Protein / belonging to T4-LIKE GC: 773 [Synechococcus phage S-PM2]|uniref:Hypothetical-Protein belonging to T4-LIKE GC: 773 n=1 Tax=Synechococcus phage S-PM2 TaxID=238854 RepID=Q5GQS6_BPSYP|nr:Hypothetical-Protein / belonging to T4-LIKE GC: 773 [Synechococcus phage S-PM2]CAF34092.1 Hypothetical-Protein / belonging to T4-LIKE GC: 773 [Synechococcus phage S-PM2]